MFRTPSRILFPARSLTSPFRQPFSPSHFPPRPRPASSFKDFIDGIVEAVASPGPPMRNWKVRHSKETFEGLREMQSKGDEYKYKPPNANTGVSLCSWSLSLWVEQADGLSGNSRNNRIQARKLLLRATLIRRLDTNSLTRIVKGVDRSLPNPLTRRNPIFLDPRLLRRLKPPRKNEYCLHQSITPEDTGSMVVVEGWRGSTWDERSKCVKK